MPGVSLYRVNLAGAFFGISHKIFFGESYVVAANPQKAYEMVRNYLDNNNIGFPHERALRSVELLAEDSSYPECGHMLFVEPLPEQITEGDGNGEEDGEEKNP